MKRIRCFAFLSAFCLVLSLAAAPLQSQCTAPDPARSLEVMKAAAGNDWPLPLVRDARIDGPEDFRGALMLASGQVYQIESIVWQVGEAGNLSPRTFRGYSRDGVRVDVERAEPGARVIRHPGDFADFKFGNPISGGGKTLSVSSARFGTDSDGYLTVTSMRGFDDRTQAYVSYDRPARAAAAQPAPRCGIRVETGCDSSQCVGGACGGAPACPCNGTSGACSGYSHTSCVGDCPLGQECNGDVNNCKCVPKPKPADN